MSKKKIFSTSLIVLGMGLFLFAPTYAEANGLIDVVFEGEPEPLFKEANFLPGQEVVRWVEVTNKSGETKKIGVEIINNSPCSVNCLSDVLDLVIKEKGTILYSGSLTTFYEAGEKILSDLGPGTTTRYYVSITFNPGAGNIYQNSNTNFNIKIGCFGEESIGEEITPGGGGGGGRIIAAGLEISNEQFSEISEKSVTITWNTNFEGTSRVIYSPQGFPHLLQLNNPPNYGYVFSTDEDSNKVIKHIVHITGLTPGTTYYYRCVSHGSLAISTEYSFTTLGIKEVGEEVEGEEIIEGKPAEGKIKGIGEAEEGAGVVGKKEKEKEEREEGEKEEGEGELEGPELAEVETEEPAGLGKFLAAIGTFPLNLKVILIILALILIGLFILWLIKKKKERK